MHRQDSSCWTAARGAAWHTLRAQVLAVLLCVPLLLGVLEPMIGAVSCAAPDLAGQPLQALISTAGPTLPAATHCAPRLQLPSRLDGLHAPSHDLILITAIGCLCFALALALLRWPALRCLQLAGPPPRRPPRGTLLPH